MKLFRQLRWQLMLSYLPLILAPVFLVGLVTRTAAEEGLTLLVTQGAQQQAHLLSDCFANYYETHGSWNGLSALLKPPLPAAQMVPGLRLWVPDRSDGDNRNAPHGVVFDLNLNCRLVPDPATPAARSSDSLLPTPETPQAYAPPGSDGDRNPQPSMLYSLRGFSRPGEILVTDPVGKVVASNNESSMGRTLSGEALSHGAPIVVHTGSSYNQVGTLVVGTSLDILDQQQNESLGAVNRALFLSGMLSVILAVALGWGLSGQITIPVRQLMAGVKRLSTGEWSSPLQVHAQNEFGELTQAFNTMANEVTHQHQLNRQMIADIAHDLRTPLSVMSLEVEAIEAGFQTPGEATASLRNEITWLQRLVEDLRLLSLMDADQIHLLPDQIPLNAFLSGILDFWQTMADESELTLTLDAPDDLPDAWIDPVRMRQTLSNLIDNAIRHTKPGGHIVLEARAEGDQVIFRVKDDGEGIAHDDLPHIFDRFYRSDPARRRSDSGSGLGLSISRRLVEMHRGTISVSSVLGKGTTFTLRVPRAEPPAPKDGHKKGRPTSGKVCGQGGEGRQT